MSPKRLIRRDQPAAALISILVCLGGCHSLPASQQDAPRRVEAIESGEPSIPAGLSEALAQPVVGRNPKRELFAGVQPKSGDYVSYAVYYWPDPKSKDGLPYISNDGKKNPELMSKGDAPNKRLFMRTVHLLARGWERTRDSVYSERAAEWLRHWFIDPATRMNPNLTFAQIRPGTTTVGHGGGIIDFANLPLLLDDLDALRASSALTPSEWTLIRGWMTDYSRWLIESPQGAFEHKSKNNHFVYYMGQRTRLAEFLGEPDTARELLEEAFSRIDAHIEPDGRQPMETKRVKGFEYSIYGLSAWQQLAMIGSRLGKNYWEFVSPRGASLKGAYLFLEQYTGSSGKAWPQTGKPYAQDILRGVVKPHESPLPSHEHRSTEREDE